MSQYRYFGDYFDPQKHKLQKQQQQINALKIQQAEQQQQRMEQQQQQEEKFNQYLSGENQQTLPNLLAGQKKLAFIGQMTDKLFSSKNVDGNRINKTNDLMQRDQDIQAAIKQGGFDNIQFSYDKDKKQASQLYTKNYSREELDEMSQLPGGNFLSGLAPGKHTINFDPINGTIRPVTAKSISKGSSQTDILNDSSLTETDLIRASLYGTPEQQKQAKRILEEKKIYTSEAYADKYGGGITEKGINFGAQQYIYTGKMPPMGRSPRIRAQIMEKSADIAKSLKMSVPELLSMQNWKKGLALSLSQQLKQRGAMGSYVRNISKQTKRLKEKLPELTRSNSRIMNIPIREFKNKIKGSADERIFETYLGEISSEIAKLSTGATGSVAEISMSAREKWEKIHDPNLPVGEMVKLINEIEHLGKVRLKSVDDEINFTKKKLGMKAGYKKQPQTKKYNLHGYQFEEVSE